MKIFLFYFEMAIKITGSAQNYRVGRVSGNTPIFFLGLKHETYKTWKIYGKEMTLTFNTHTPS